MSSWNVLYSDYAKQDLRDIYLYIANSLLQSCAAKKQVERIMDAADSLEEMPCRYKLYDKEPWKSKGLRLLPVDNFVLFYRPSKSEKTVLIVRVMYGARDIKIELNKQL